MNGIIGEQVATARASHPDVTADPRPDGTVLVTVRDLRLPPGWNKSTCCVYFLLPVGYPVSRPDCFWAEPDLRLAGGGMPTNTNLQTVPSTSMSAVWFSWHLASWNPAEDDLLSYVRAIRGRFLQAR